LGQSYGSPHDRARDLLEEGHVDKAKAAYLRLAEQDPRDKRAIRGLAMCAREEADDAEAIRWWEKLLPLTDGDEKAGTWKQIAMAHHRMGNENEALVAAQSAMSLSNGTDASLNDLLAKLLTSSSGSPSQQQPMGLRGGMPRSPTPKPPDPLEMLPRKKP
jgi:tetratricopeptide (TPR) repeat protein